MENILIVDDDKNFLDSLSEGLIRYNDDFNILKADNGRMAVDILENITVDLVISDLNMPEMDGFELLAYISKYHKNLSVIIITAFGTPEIEDRLQEISTFQYIEKPLDFNYLVEKIENTLNAISSGEMMNKKLPAFLQLINMDKKNRTLKIISNENAGFLYIKNGEIINAETGKLSGVLAAKTIIRWKNPEIEILKKYKKKKKIILMPLNVLLTEALAEKDDNIEEVSDEISKVYQFDADIENIINEKLEPFNDQKSINKKKEVIMNTKKLNEAIMALKTDLEDALISTDIWMNEDGQSISGINSQPKAVALFNRMTDQIDVALGDSGFPTLAKYYILDLVDDKLVVVLPLGKFRWGMLIDSNKAKLGLLLNIAIPRCIEIFYEAENS